MDQLSQWFEASEKNRKEWLKLRMTLVKNKYNAATDPKHLQTSYNEIKKQQQEYDDQEKRITRKITLQFRTYAACIILLIGISFASYKSIRYFTDPQLIVFSVGKHEPVRRFMLEDSTSVWLSSGSRIEYPKRFGKKERNVFVEGKAYFEVSKDAGRPFFVKTESYMVKVLGTSFEVNTYKDERLSDVVLVEGSVEILNNNLASLCTLHPGQQFELNRQNYRFLLNEVDVELYTSWRSGKIEFDGMSFGDILKVLERYYKVQLVLDESINKEEKLVGSLSLEKDIYEMMKTIELVVPIKYEVQTNTVVYIQSKQ
jgi:ferric-dicitrate binding protein FerR (iron transport regulator)